MSNSPRYGTNNQNTSKYVSDLLNDFVKMPRGSFNLVRRKTFDAPIGFIVPFECWEMLPNSELYVSHDIQVLSKNPTIKRLLSSMNIEVAYYRVDYNDCWEGWNNFITKGRSGRISKNIPYVDFSLGDQSLTTGTPYCPLHYLNIAPAPYVFKSNPFSFVGNYAVHELSYLELSGLSGAGLNSPSFRVSALPFVMYNKIAKHYMTSNLLQDNPHWFPENEDHDQQLPYDCPEAVTTSDHYNPTHVYSRGDPIQPNAQKTGDDYKSYPWLNVLWAAQRKGDYFNTASPFPELVRGDIPTLDVLQAQVTLDDATLEGFKTVINGQGSRPVYSQNPNPTNDAVPFHVRGDQAYAGLSSGLSPLLANVSGLTAETTGNVKFSKAVLSGIAFSMSQWRYLATMTVLRERLALTDGSYNQMIKAIFGHNPRWHGNDVTYCGGFTQPIVFSEVVNTAETDSAPLGDTAGRAVSSQSGRTIHIKSDDYGMYMAVLVIKTDEYYSQGVDKMWSRLTNAEQYMPILNNLSPDAIKNKELYISGDNDVDEDVFAYQERFAFYKSRRNQISGLMALPISKVGDVGAYVQNRLFSSTPKFNSEFSRYSLTDNEKAIFAGLDQAEFTITAGCRMKFIAPIPEDSHPSTMGISY